LRLLPLPLEIRNHRPPGFAWGYGGGGPAQLALALLLDATGDAELALRHYPIFKRCFVAGWKSEWRLAATAIRAFRAAQESRSVSAHDAQALL